MDLKKKIRSFEDWPIKGVIFRDITTLLQDGEAFKKSCDIFYERYKNKKIDKVVGIDARGFIFAPVIAYKLGIGFVPVRKKNKLPGSTISESYSLEYGENSLEMHKDAINKGEKVLIIDDLLATGGTIQAVRNLVKKLEAEVVECAFLIELPDLKGRERIKEESIFSIMEFAGG